MMALRYSQTEKVTLATINMADTQLEQNEALVKVLRAGICSTDLEILKGYRPDFDGVLGHEFVGRVIRVGHQKSSHWIGKRVCADINVKCRKCAVCLNSVANTSKFHKRNHCFDRRCIGIRQFDGCFASHMRIPIENLYEVVEAIPDVMAVFAEPLAAALRPLEQRLIPISSRVAIVGDGKLGWLIAEVLVLRLKIHGHTDKSISSRIQMFGRHPESHLVITSRTEENGDAADFEACNVEGGICLHAARYDTIVGCGFFDVWVAPCPALNATFDVVIDASGSSSGVSFAVNLVAPEGLLILKTTLAEGTTQLLTTIVVNEVRMCGSRCGSIEDALKVMSGQCIPDYMLENDDLEIVTNDNKMWHLHLEKYVCAVYPLEEGLIALQEASRPGVLKVQLLMG